MNAAGEIGAACNHNGFSYAYVQEGKEPEIVNVIPIINNGGVPTEV